MSRNERDYQEPDMNKVTYYITYIFFSIKKSQLYLFFSLKMTEISSFENFRALYFGRQLWLCIFWSKFWSKK